MDFCRKGGDDEDVPLPGFRFHPTDEELVGFYLRRKIDKKPFAIELIKHVDIYKYDPWDLPKGSNVGDKEWYFFCKRGRKYRNSVRPNRVTGSGFWKATGIDRPIYSTGGHQCIGLKKSLVYYRGSAGKGTKTDWMMHEFRLPADPDHQSTKHIDVKNIIIQEAEVWTLCRILKRNSSSRKCTPDWREHSAKQNTTPRVDSNNNDEGYNIDFRNPTISQNQKKNFVNHDVYGTSPACVSHLSSMFQAHSATSYSSFSSPVTNAITKINGGWDELKSVVDFATDHPSFM